MQAQPNDASSVVCDQCNSPDVVAMDDQGHGFCGRCRSYSLGADEGAAQASLGLIEEVIGSALEHGFVHPDDLRASVEATIEQMMERRERAGLSEAPTWERTQDALHDLSEFEGLGRRDGS